jgi:hypothetical protein
MPAKFIKVNNGTSTQYVETEADTIGELFTAEFREDHGISRTGKPTVNGIVVSDSTEIEPEMTIGYMNGASAKS